MVKSKFMYIGIIAGMLFCVFLSGCDSKSAMEFQTVESDAEEVENDGTAIEKAKTASADGSEEKTGDGSDTSSKEQSSSSEDKEYEAGESLTGDDEVVIYVHICGEVINPGVYEIQPDERLFMLVEKAGGFTKEAATDYINQAMIIKDGDKIYVPSQAEAAESGTSLMGQGDSLKGQISNTNSGEQSSSPDSEAGLLDLNTATEEELMTLPGIGASKAKKITAYREEIGKFENIEQIMDIAGIKEGVYNNIKNYVIVR